jgi:predicted RNA binding protein YcfA (HicA-like mRNA interferase family)
MAKEMKSVEVVRVLKHAGWVPVRMKGSHQMWQSPTGRKIAVPVGHKIISAGVVQQVMKAIEEEAA